MNPEHSVDDLPAQLAAKIHVHDWTGCWLWTGSTRADGYPLVKWKRSTRSAHRVTWEVLEGELGDDDEVDHRCRYRACVRPRSGHCQAVDAATNARRRDAAARVKRDGLRAEPVLLAMLERRRRVDMDDAITDLANKGFTTAQAHDARRLIGAVSVRDVGGWAWCVPGATPAELLGLDGVEAEDVADRVATLRRLNDRDVVEGLQGVTAEDLADARDTAARVEAAADVVELGEATGEARRGRERAELDEARRAAGVEPERPMTEDEADEAERVLAVLGGDEDPGPSRPAWGRRTPDAASAAPTAEDMPDRAAKVARSWVAERVAARGERPEGESAEPAGERRVLGEASPAELARRRERRRRRGPGARDRRAADAAAAGVLARGGSELQARGARRRVLVEAGQAAAARDRARPADWYSTACVAAVAVMLTVLVMVHVVAPRFGPAEPPVWTGVGSERADCSTC